MPAFETTQFGRVDYDEPAVVHFLHGLPAFESETRFLIIEQDSTAPVVFLQSLSTPGLVFLTLPVRFLDPGYELSLAADDLAALGLPADARPEDGADVLALAILTVRPGQPVTANLMAPVVVEARTRRAVQAVQAAGGRYSVAHPLLKSATMAPGSGEGARCS
jgi:flagellar assembly factor FliW